MFIPDEARSLTMGCLVYFTLVILLLGQAVQGIAEVGIVD